MTDLEKYEGILLVCSYVFSFFIFILGISVYYLTFPLQVGLFELPAEKINEVLLLALLGVVFNEGYFSKRRVCFLLSNSKLRFSSLLANFRELMYPFSFVLIFALMFVNEVYFLGIKLLNV